MHVHTLTLHLRDHDRELKEAFVRIHHDFHPQGT